MGRSEDKKVQDAAKDRAVLTPPRKKVRRERVEKAKWTWKAPRKKPPPLVRRRLRDC